MSYYFKIRLKDALSPAKTDQAGALLVYLSIVGRPDRHDITHALDRLSFIRFFYLFFASDDRFVHIRGPPRGTKSPPPQCTGCVLKR